MTATIWVTAGAGRRVRMPDSSVIADAPGAVPVLVAHDLFVQRRLDGGDLVAVPAPAATPAAAGA